MMVLGAILMVAGFVLALLGSYLFRVRADGGMFLQIPIVGMFVAIHFIINHWDDAWLPLLMQVIGIALLIGGGAMGGFLH